MCKEFEYETTMLAIGVEDENPAFETVRTTCGVEYIIHKQIHEVVFGIAWVTDHEGSYDARTWYAADPTLDKNRFFLLVRKSQSDSTGASAFVNAIFIICFLMTRQSDVSFGA